MSGNDEKLRPPCEEINRSPETAMATLLICTLLDFHSQIPIAISTSSFPNTNSICDISLLLDIAAGNSSRKHRRNPLGASVPVVKVEGSKADGGQVA